MRMGLWHCFYVLQKNRSQDKSWCSISIVLDYTTIRLHRFLQHKQNAILDVGIYRPPPNPVQCPAFSVADSKDGLVLRRDLQRQRYRDFLSLVWINLLKLWMLQLLYQLDSVSLINDHTSPFPVLSYRLSTVTL